MDSHNQSAYEIETGRPLPRPFGQTQGAEPVQRHSGLGIASFVLSLVSIALLFLLIVLAGAIDVSTPGGIDEESAEAIVIGLGIFAGLGMGVVGFGLGIGGLCQKDRKKIFAILGVVFAASACVLVLLLLLLGLSEG